MKKQSTVEPILYLVVPCYNEEAVLQDTASVLQDKLDAIRKSGAVHHKSKVLFVNDGSKDSTWLIIRVLVDKFPRDFAGLNLSTNRGHQNALLAGIMTAKDVSDVVISLDADLQDDVDAIDEMLAAHRLGYDIVYGVRNNRETDTWFKKRTAEAFYRMMAGLGVDIVFNHADYRLMSKRSLEALAEFNEVNLFLRGLVPMVGYQSTEVYYARKERQAGESKYPLTKMLGFALEGATSLSIRPIRFVTILGLLALLVAIVIFFYSLSQYVAGNTVSGWTSILVSVWMLGGAIMMSLGLVGEYVGKIYLETKSRPKYIIQDYLNKSPDDHRKERKATS